MAEELAEDPTRVVRILEAEERPRHLVYPDGSIAYGNQCFGLKGEVLPAVVTENYEPPPVVDQPRHDLDCIRTPPTPRSDSDDEDDDSLGFPAERRVIVIRPHVPKPPPLKPWENMDRKNNLSNEIAEWSAVASSRGSKQ